VAFARGIAFKSAAVNRNSCFTAPLTTSATVSATGAAVWAAATPAITPAIINPNNPIVFRQVISPRPHPGKKKPCLSFSERQGLILANQGNFASRLRREQLPERPEQKARQHHRYRQCQYPGHQQIPHCGPLQA